MYYWGYQPGTAPIYENNSYPVRQFEDNYELKQQLENLRSQLEELRNRFELLQTESRHEQSTHVEVQELEQTNDLEEKIVTLRSDQIAAFQHLLSTFLKNDSSEQVIMVQIAEPTEADARQE